MVADPSNQIRYANAPVDEFLMGVQFDAIPGLTSGHFGWFWKRYLDSQWTKSADAPFLPDIYEKFGDQQNWATPGFSFLPHSGADRLQILTESEDQILQVQGTKFFYNWRKRSSEYPTFEKASAQFRESFDQFKTFLQEAKLGVPSLNQWEISYINHIDKGTVWEKGGDLSSILPGLFPIHSQPTSVIFEDLIGEFRYEIPPRRGRLRVAVQPSKHAGGRGSEFLRLQLTARGPIVANEPDWDLDSGLNLGHRVLVQTFTDISSLAAQAHWGKE